MMAEPIIHEVKGFAIVPPRRSWGVDEVPRFERILISYGGFHIPIKGLLSNLRAVVDWEVYPDAQRWQVAHALSQHFYPNATPPQVYEQGLKGGLLISAESLTLSTVTPLPNPPSYE